MIFWGPPGVGKTTLARIIARRTRAEFIDFSAVTSGIREIRQVMEQAENSRKMGMRTVVFVDESPRFNKAQQDAFLPFVEKGSILLIGATRRTRLLDECGASFQMPCVCAERTDGAGDHGTVGACTVKSQRIRKPEDRDHQTAAGLRSRLFPTETPERRSTPWRWR